MRTRSGGGRLRIGKAYKNERFVHSFGARKEARVNLPAWHGSCNGPEFLGMMKGDGFAPISLVIPFSLLFFTSKVTLFTPSHGGRWLVLFAPKRINRYHIPTCITGNRRTPIPGYFLVFGVFFGVTLFIGTINKSSVSCNHKN